MTGLCALITEMLKKTVPKSLFWVGWVILISWWYFPGSRLHCIIYITTVPESNYWRVVNQYVWLGWLFYYSYSVLRFCTFLTQSRNDLCISLRLEVTTFMICSFCWYCCSSSAPFVPGVGLWCYRIVFCHHLVATESDHMSQQFSNWCMTGEFV